MNTFRKTARVLLRVTGFVLAAVFVQQAADGGTDHVSTLRDDIKDVFYPNTAHADHPGDGCDTDGGCGCGGC